MYDFIYCSAWSPELKAVERERQRQYYLIRSLAAKLERVEPESNEFEDTLTRLEEAQEAMRAAAQHSFVLQYQYHNAEV